MKTLSTYETRLREEVRGVTLLGELSYDEGDLAELRQMLSGMWGTSAAEGLRHVAGRYDLTLALYLVLEGAYHHDAGDYWRDPDATLRLDGNDQVLLPWPFLPFP